MSETQKLEKQDKTAAEAKPPVSLRLYLLGCAGAGLIATVYLGFIALDAGKEEARFGDRPIAAPVTVGASGSDSVRIPIAAPTGELALQTMSPEAEAAAASGHVRIIEVAELPGATPSATVRVAELERTVAELQDRNRSLEVRLGETGQQVAVQDRQLDQEQTGTGARRSTLSTGTTAAADNDTVDAALSNARSAGEDIAAGMADAMARAVASNTSSDDSANAGSSTSGALRPASARPHEADGLTSLSASRPVEQGLITGYVVEPIRAPVERPVAGHAPGLQPSSGGNETGAALQTPSHGAPSPRAALSSQATPLGPETSASAQPTRPVITAAPSSADIANSAMPGKTTPVATDTGHTTDESRMPALDWGKAEVTEVVQQPPFDPARLPLPQRKTYGAALAEATNLESLRLNWLALNDLHRYDLVGLSARYQVISGNLGTRYRLIAGPFENIAAAEKLCAVVATPGVGCAPALFAGIDL